MKTLGSIAFLGMLALSRVAALATTIPFVATGSVWKYLDNGSDQGTAWQAPAFNDAAWQSGSAQLGYGDGDEATVVGYGPDPNAKYITTYFRKAFPVINAAGFTSVTLRLLRDDGAVVYLNGTEVFRSNMPGGAITYTTAASSAVGGATESQFFSTTVDPALLVEGTNVLAVEIHQSGGTSSDISFDLELTGTDHVTRGPYLQSGTPTGVVVRWRTDIATDSRVRYGTSLGSLTQTADAPAVTTEHIVPLGGLSAGTKYYYSVGTSSAPLAGGDGNHFFVTAPLAGTAQPTRIWVLGDSGTADTNAQAVRNAFDSFATGTRKEDLWLMLGDNAYTSGTDGEYQAAVFDMYPTHLRNAVLWPTLGNHDGISADSATQTGPYYDIFTLPAQGQAGGVPSGTEAYYAFDYANIHFICLDSQESDRSPSGAMLTWLSDDLLATNADWIIAFWHHPPYSKGSHDSDVETQLIEMRQNALPILEAHGVDLVLTGHSHSYERSMLLDAHYGLSTTLSGSMILDAGDGRLDGNGAYAKATLGPAAHEGAVYVVAGSSGQTSSGPLNHPAMYVSLPTLGSVVLDVDHNVLNAKFINNAGGASDYFTMTKGGPLCGNGLKEIDEACDRGDLGGVSCGATGCSGGTLTCTASCTLDYSACTGCATPTNTPTHTPAPTPTSTVAPRHDTVLLPVKPVSVIIPRGATEVVKTIPIYVSNADVLPTKEQAGHVVRLTAAPGDCPALTIDGKPDFDIWTAGDQDTALVIGGAVKKARVRLRVSALDYLTYNSRAPTRCTLMLSASTDVVGNADPTPHNNVQPLELNVWDATDQASAATHESVIRSVQPVTLTIRDGATVATRSVTVTLVNADKPEDAGHPITLSVNGGGSDCPAGTVSLVEPSTVSVKGGTSRAVRATVQVSAVSFTAANARAPDRCVVLLEANTDVANNTEPDASNNATRLVINVDDKTDY